MNKRLLSRIFYLALGSVMIMVIFVSAPPQAAGQAVEWKFAQVTFPADSPIHKDALKMLKRVTDRSGGKFTFKVYGSELCGWEELDEMFRRGGVDLVFNPITSASDPRWNVLYAGAVAKDYESLAKLFGPGGNVTKIVQKFAPDSNAHWLGSWVGFFTGMALKNKKPMSPEEAKGIKVRVPGITILQCTAAALGYTPSALPFAEVPTAVATGVVEGAGGGGAYQNWVILRDLCNVLMMDYEFIDLYGIMANLDAWKKLPQPYQSILQEEADRIVKERMPQVKEEELFYQNKLVKEHKWTVIDMLNYPERHAKNVELMRKCWDTSLTQMVGSALVNQLKEATK